MMDDDVPIEIPSPPIAVPETDTLFRLVPIDSGTGRYVALIAAADEEQARRFALESDPFGGEWDDPSKFKCELSGDGHTHVVGDVVFQSNPAPPVAKRLAQSR